MAAEEPITGQIAVTLRDEVSAIWGMTPERDRLMKPLVAISGLFLIYAAATFGPAFDDMRWAFALVGFVFTAFTLFLPIVVAFAHLRSSPEGRQWYVAVDADKIEKRNGAGSVFAYSWRDVRWCRENSLGFIFSVKPLGIVYLPKKAFTASAVQSLRKLVSKRLGKAAEVLKDTEVP